MFFPGRETAAGKSSQPILADYMMIKHTDINWLTGEVIGSAIEVHKTLGPGLLESAYEECLCKELMLRNIAFDRQKALPIQ